MEDKVIVTERGQKSAPEVPSLQGFVSYEVLYSTACIRQPKKRAD